MKKHLSVAAGIMLLWASPLFPWTLSAQAVDVVKTQEAAGAGGAGQNLSLKLEVQHSVEKALKWFGKNQHPGGYWSQPEYPALTALVLTAFMGEPANVIRANPPDGVKKGYEYLLQCVKPDGGIYVKGMNNYNTSIAMMALMSGYNPTYEPILRKARNFVTGLQDDFDEKGKIDNAFDGGIGYGDDKAKHSDMSNTVYALEAIHYTKFLKNDTPSGTETLKELNWPAAIRFIERSQNLPGTNDQPWATGDEKNKGGFVYSPAESMAGEDDQGGGKKALRSYGSISYAGLLSYIYTDLKKDDPRVKAVLDWLQKNYTLEENPGMGKDGLFYYYHTMAKGLSAAGVDNITLADGKTIDWRKDLATKLLNMQNAEGFWVNENGRWWEKDPVLVTAYATIAMEILYRGL